MEWDNISWYIYEGSSSSLSIKVKPGKQFQLIIILQSLWSHSQPIYRPITCFCYVLIILWEKRLVIYCRNLQSNLHRDYSVEFFLAKLLIRSQNRGVECGSNPGSNSRWPSNLKVRKSHENVRFSYFLIRFFE